MIDVQISVFPEDICSEWLEEKQLAILYKNLERRVEEVCSQISLHQIDLGSIERDIQVLREARRLFPQRLIEGIGVFIPERNQFPDLEKRVIDAVYSKLQENPHMQTLCGMYPNWESMIRNMEVAHLFFRDLKNNTQSAGSALKKLGQMKKQAWGKIAKTCPEGAFDISEVTKQLQSLINLGNRICSIENGDPLEMIVDETLVFDTEIEGQEGIIEARLIFSQWDTEETILQTEAFLENLRQRRGEVEETYRRLVQMSAWVASNLPDERELVNREIDSLIIDAQIIVKNFFSEKGC